MITLTTSTCMIIHKIINHNLKLYCLSGYKMECLSGYCITLVGYLMYLNSVNSWFRLSFSDLFLQMVLNSTNA